ncbi:MAG TPA: hypothetical protein IAC79_03610 [Candidatus Spyradenecus faecavium]|uniref:Uncharacterized protein n=1 Tax=Candidatus Spyradenecus faecavium TaxID=2840947 RepID=A0A9D1NM45_9BACT|nr:hypothetical protein [Candidatus Spyradenecus faecavium]
MKQWLLMLALLAALSLPLAAVAGEGPFGIGRDDPALAVILERFGQDLEAQTPALGTRTRDRVALAALIAVNAPTSSSWVRRTGGAPSRRPWRPSCARCR